MNWLKYPTKKAKETQLHYDAMHNLEQFYFSAHKHKLVFIFAFQQSDPNEWTSLQEEFKYISRECNHSNGFF